MSTTTQIRVAHYSGEGYFPEAKLPYKDWRVITEPNDDDTYCLVLDYSSPFVTLAEATTMCNDYATWLTQRAAPVYTYI